MSSNLYYYIYDQFLLADCLRFRFAPEPSGVLHVGHLFMIYINFIFSDLYFCVFSVRFDDSNPLSSSLRFFFSIRYDLFYSLGLASVIFTYSSSYFYILYIILKDFIFFNVSFIFFCFFDFRYNVVISGFYYVYYILKKIRVGLFIYNEYVVLFYMYHLYIYRIKYVYHYIFKYNWCFYPLYDYVNSVLDCLEYISLSVCSIEFVSRRFYYYYVSFLYNLFYFSRFFCYQFEFSKLCSRDFVIGKRFINSLLCSRFIFYYSDIRLPTIKALINRYHCVDSMVLFFKTFLSFNGRYVFLSLLSDRCYYLLLRYYCSGFLFFGVLVSYVVYVLSSCFFRFTYICCGVFFSNIGVLYRLTFDRLFSVILLRRLFIYSRFSVFFGGINLFRGFYRFFDGLNVGGFFLYIYSSDFLRDGFLYFVCNFGLYMLCFVNKFMVSTNGLFSFRCL